MPEKSLAARAKRAKKEGTALVMKEQDLGREAPASPHARKKSPQVARVTSTPERRASPKAPPGTGKNSRRKTVAQRQAAYMAGRSDRDEMRPVARTQGRKKAPSRMNVKSKGGPRKRSRLHGG